MSLYSSTLMTYLHDIITEIAQIRQHQEYVVVRIVMCLFLRENNSNSSSLLEIFSRWHLYCKCCFVLFHSQVKSCTFQHKSRNITHSAYICHIGTYINYIYIDQLLLAFSSSNITHRAD